jgi:hypothetical protein
MIVSVRVTFYTIINPLDPTQGLSFTNRSSLLLLLILSLMIKAYIVCKEGVLLMFRDYSLDFKMVKLMKLMKAVECRKEKSSRKASI